METALYLKKQEELLSRYEARCARCGACCGVTDGDPCASLQKSGDGTYFCKAYAARLGAQKTVSGKSFTCVPIRAVLKYESPHPGCAYVKRTGTQGVFSRDI
jgi:hypothetical protein